MPAITMTPMHQMKSGAKTRPKPSPTSSKGSGTSEFPFTLRELFADVEHYGADADSDEDA